MAQNLNLGDLLAAVKVRWNQQNLSQTITGGITESFPRENTSRPYAVVAGLAATSAARTNQSKLSRWRFTIHVFDTPSENVWQEMRQIVDALEYAPLTLPGTGLVLQVRNTNDGGIIIPEDYFAHGVIELRADVTQAVNYHPG